MNAMTLVTTLTPATRADLARDTAPKFKLAQWTLQERVENALIENKMIAAAPKRKPNAAWFFGAAEPEKTALGWTDVSGEFIAALTKPLTAAELAAKLKRPVSGTARQLTYMKSRGAVRVVGKVQHGGSRVNLWAATGAKSVGNPSHAAARDKARQRVTNILDRPMTAGEIGEATGMTDSAVRTRLKDMLGAGLVKVHALEKGKNGQTTKTWVRA